MRNSLLLLAATTVLSAHTLAQDEHDIGNVTSGGNSSLAGWNDDFTRPDGPIGGQWSILSGTWAVQGGQGSHTSTGVNELLQHNLANAFYTSAVVELDVLCPGSTSQFSGVVIGLGGSDAILVKLQDQVPGTPGFSHIGIYHRTSATGWGAWSGGTGTAFLALTTPFVAGRVTVDFPDADTCRVQIDTNGDGLADETSSRTNVLSIAPNFGTGIGIAAWGSGALFDNFSARSSQVVVSSGSPSCQSALLDFDSPFVPSGPIASSAGPFVSNGIASVVPFGTWSTGGDTLSAGSNGSGQSLVCQGGGSLAVAGIGQPLDNAAAGAGFDIQLNRPVRAFGVLFVDQINFAYDVELFSGGSPVGVANANYSGSFPAPPVTFRVADGCSFDRIRIVFGGPSIGVGIDNLWLDDCHRTDVAGGAIPAAGTGGGSTYPALPPSPLEVGLALPFDARTIERVSFLNISHTWVGDLQAVLVDPFGTSHNLFFRPGSTGPSVGNSGDLLNDDIGIVESGAGTLPSAGDVASGLYNQLFGAWVDGTNGIFNTPLSNVPVVPGGAYLVRIYDWAGGDIGTVVTVQVFGRAGSDCGPFSYCVAGTSSSGCVPSLTANANPDVGHLAPCVLTATNVEGAKNGLLFYGLSPSQSSWCPSGSSFLCVKAPTQRTPGQASGGVANTCTGTLTLDWNAFVLANPSAYGVPFGVGDTVYVQGWFRDPASCKTTSLTGGLGLTYQP